MEEQKKTVDEQLMSLLKSDGLGQVPDSVPSPNNVLLPKPISDKIQAEIVERNFVRRLFPSITIPRNEGILLFLHSRTTPSMCTSFPMEQT